MVPGMTQTAHYEVKGTGGSWRQHVPGVGAWCRVLQMTQAAHDDIAN